MTTPLSWEEVQAQGGVLPILIGGLEGLQKRLDIPGSRFTGGAKLIARAEFVVDRLGCVRRIEIVESEHEGLSIALVRALEQSRFQPGMVDGDSVDVRLGIPASVQSR